MNKTIKSLLNSSIKIQEDDYSVKELAKEVIKGLVLVTTMFIMLYILLL